MISYCIDLDELKNGGKIVFVRKIPYDGYFYADKAIYIHKKEACYESLSGKYANPNYIFLMRSHYVERVSEDVMASNTRIRKVGEFIVLKKKQPKYPRITKMTKENNYE